MFPILFSIPEFHFWGMDFGPIRLHSYGLMVAIGFLTSLHLGLREGDKLGWDRDRVATGAFVTLLLSVAGTRILYIIMYPQGFYWNDPVGWFALWRGGLVFQGVLPVIAVCTYVGFKRLNIPYWQGVDVAASYLPLGEGLGRIGCFLNGCCFGKRSDALPWAIRFPKDSYAYAAHEQYPDFPATAEWSCPVHPTQLYSVASLLLIFFLILWMRRKWNPFQGFVLPCYLVLAGLYRLIVEFFRGDGNPTNLGFGVLSNQQVFCIGMMIAGVMLFEVLRRRSARATSARRA